MSQIKECWRWLDQMRSSVTDDQHLPAKTRFEVSPAVSPIVSALSIQMIHLFDSQWGSCFLVQPRLSLRWNSWLLIPPPPHCTSRFVRCDTRFCLTYSNSLMRSPVPGYPIRLRLPELSSLALTNQFTPSPSTKNLPSISSTNQKLSFVMAKL